MIIIVVGMRTIITDMNAMFQENINTMTDTTRDDSASPKTDPHTKP
jgi:hypothetical protein